MVRQHKRMAIYFYKVFKKDNKRTRLHNVALFCSNYRQVSVTHMAIIWVVRTRIQLQLSCVVRKSTFIKSCSFD